MMKRDKAGNLYYASLQGETAKQHLDAALRETIDTIILKSASDIHLQSSASIRAISKLGGIYKIIIVLLLVPPFIRNWVYGIISKNRYRWFGRKDHCRIPSKEEAGRFLP